MTAIMAFESPGPPRAAAIAMARMIDGNESTASQMRMINVSSFPPAKPAIAPMVQPMMTVTATTRMPAGTETRAA